MRKAPRKLYCLASMWACLAGIAWGEKGGLAIPREHLVDEGGGLAPDSQLWCWPGAGGGAGEGLGGNRAAAVRAEHSKIKSTDRSRVPMPRAQDYDRNGDFWLDADEVAQIDERRRIELMRIFDSDRDGILSSEELARVATKTAPLPPEPEPEYPSAPSAPEMGRWLALENKARMQTVSTPRPAAPAAVHGAIPGLEVCARKPFSGRGYGRFNCDPSCAASFRIYAGR